jgi:endoglucanase
MLSSVLESCHCMLLIWLFFAFQPKPAVAPGLGEGFWHTRGSQIVDASNNPVRIAGINWYGFESAQQAPGGLDTQDYRTILQTIHRSGYNAIRIPLSNQMVETPIVPTAIRYTGRDGEINTALKGLNSLQVLDKIIAYAGEQGLKVILDNHRSEAGDGAELSGLWFTQGYPESAWIVDWQMLARRYANDPTVLGFDLRNEPHNAASNGACWSCGGANDWHLAAQRAGNAVLSINPRLLIFVEGVDMFDNDFYWWGGNLEGVHSAPVKLSVPNQLVYSAHDYGPTESGQSWFTPEMSPKSLSAVWMRHWGYISQQGIAPVWLGEFGADAASTANPATPPTAAEALESRWFQALVQFLNTQPRINWTYWAANATDHYGMMSSAYDNIKDSSRQDALTSLQFPLRIGLKPTGKASSQSSTRNHVGGITIIEPAYAATAPQSAPLATSLATPPAPAVAPANTPAPTVDSDLRCHISYTDLNDWKSGFTSGIVIHNTGASPIDGWTLSWTFDGNQKISQIWNARYAVEGSTITLTNESWNATIAPNGEQAGIGFNADYTTQNHIPNRFYLNGTLCK